MIVFDSIDDHWQMLTKNACPLLRWNYYNLTHKQYGNNSGIIDKNFNCFMIAMISSKVLFLRKKRLRMFVYYHLGG